ncbi:hypothetical protein ABIC99_003916 [Sphaerotilus sulfidivorans]|uniref:Uncharacterized protein n=1 Tax=Sphaerotilus sulfidivorans TaxID=639200 RepID=A0A5C1PYX7_9BURK|nr:hypothetical protein [Sphaerotilus sulfidivorans]NZD47964.1 hypothetical protein [Sphaerotilus sulfidivorans]QEN00627.1 hypothetical protein EWH46_07465 [Sphaerotilus sulfidivorans]
MPTAPTPTLGDYIAMWGVQDGLLQQYRVIFITMQSVFLSFAVTSLFAGSAAPAEASALSKSVSPLMLIGDGPVLPIAILAVVAIYVIRQLWVPLCRARADAVSLAQFLALQVEAGGVPEAPVKTLKDFQAGNRKDIEANLIFQGLRKSPGRGKMEIVLPRVFYIAWAAILIVLAFKYGYIALLPRGV